MEKTRQYYSDIGMGAISHIPRREHQRILKIDKAWCNILLYLKENNSATEVIGVEIMRLTGSNQESPFIDEIKTISRKFFLGDFRYDANGGILDNTHLLFFQKKYQAIIIHRFADSCLL